MKARILGTLFVLLILAIVYGFTQDDFSPSGNSSPAAQVQSAPAPSSSDNDMKSLKIN